MTDPGYGADKVWKQLRRGGRDVARCTVERLMRMRPVRRRTWLLEPIGYIPLAEAEASDYRQLTGRVEMA